MLNSPKKAGKIHTKDRTDKNMKKNIIENVFDRTITL